MSEGIYEPRPSSFFWIKGPDGEPEPARWDAEAGLWFLIGAAEGQDAATVLGPVQRLPAGEIRGADR